MYCIPKYFGTKWRLASYRCSCYLSLPVGSLNLTQLGGVTKMHTSLVIAKFTIFLQQYSSSCIAVNLTIVSGRQHRSKWTQRKTSTVRWRMDTKEVNYSTVTFGHKGRQLQGGDVWTQRKTTTVRWRLDTKEVNCSTVTYGHKGRQLQGGDVWRQRKTTTVKWRMDTKEVNSSTVTYGHKGSQLQYSDVWTQRKTKPGQWRLDTKEDNSNRVTFRHKVTQR